MGKMKGNRLNTAVNTGSFITGRQQLKVQRQIAYNTGIQAQLAQMQLHQFQIQQAAEHKAQLDAEFSQLCAWADQEVAAGRRTQEDASAYVTRYWRNKISAPPKIDKLIVGSSGDFLRKTIGFAGISAGWYLEESGTTARYWDGAGWTEEVQNRQAAQAQVRFEAAELKAQRKMQKSAVQEVNSIPLEHAHAQQSAIPAPARLPGWYPMQGEGILRYWDGTVWTEHTHPQAPGLQ